MSCHLHWVVICLLERVYNANLRIFFELYHLAARQCLFSLILCLCGRALSGSVGRWPDVWGSRLRNCGSLKSLHARTCRCSCGAAPQARRRWCAGRRYARICCHSNSGCVRFFFNSAFFLLIHGVRQRSCYA